MPSNIVFVIMDSCRFDSYEKAATPNMDRLGAGELRYSYASWTSPSHYTFLMGLLPHQNPRRVFASEIYKSDFTKWVERVGIDDLSFKTFVPELSLPKVLQLRGYRTVARVSLPVLHPLSGMGRHFDSYELMENHNDFAGMVDEIEFSRSQPALHFLNLGETHYPYMLDPAAVPHMSGVHGVFKRLGDSLDPDAEPKQAFFSEQQLSYFHDQQVRAVEYVDEVLDDLIAKAPVGTHFIVTSDHGECFGEGAFFGHGPIFHPKVFEVPFLEGKKR